MRDARARAARDVPAARHPRRLGRADGRRACRPAPRSRSRRCARCAQLLDAADRRRRRSRSWRSAPRSNTPAFAAGSWTRWRRAWPTPTRALLPRHPHAERRAGAAARRQRGPGARFRASPRSLAGERLQPAAQRVRGGGARARRRQRCATSARSAARRGVARAAAAARAPRRHRERARAARRRRRRAPRRSAS